MASTSRRATQRGQRGFTLIESLIATVVLAAAVVGIAGTLASTYQQQKDQVSASEATQLARQLMEEISAKPFVAPAGSNIAGWSAGNKNRATYDEIADYDSGEHVVVDLGEDRGAIVTHHHSDYPSIAEPTITTRSLSSRE